MVAKRKARDDKKSPPRTFPIQPHGPRQTSFCPNTIKTSKYSVIPVSIDFFLWKNLFEQFMRIANLYFLIIAILQLIPDLSPTGRFSTTLTLIFVLAVSAIKAAYEDWKRHRSDREVNGRRGWVFRDGEWQATPWKELAVGNVVKVFKGREFPADLILLSSSDEEGTAYVETSNLDGETNLKRKRALDGTLKYSSESSLSSLQGEIHCEGPNRRLYEFTGTLTTDHKTLSLDPAQILLRGSQLRKIEFVIGIVIFTGPDTKIMQNSSKPPTKRSRMEVNVNKFLIYIFVTQIILVVFSSIMLAVSPVEKRWYLSWDPDKTLLFLVSLPTFLILFNNLIPISLYVSMEMVKFGQGWFINHDLGMYYHTKGMPAIARTTSLNEELGQVQHIFSDKTGTLTCNVMKFFKFSVAGVSYGKGTTEIGRAAAKRMGKTVVDERPLSVIGQDSQFWDERIVNERWRNDQRAPQIREFFTLLSLCHTVVTEKTTSGEYSIQAESPDEAALVEAANNFGFKFVDRLAGDVVLVNIDGVDRRYVLRNVLEFNSVRKRMSTIVEDDDGNIILYSKGADSTLYPRLKPDALYTQETKQHLNTFGDEGLRTLVCAKAELDRDKYEQWNARWAAAKRIVGDERDKELDKLADEIETNLDFVGATAIEDKLQDGVPETIERLRTAGVKIWMLTGDKQETAINIGFACALVHTQMEIIILNKSDPVFLQADLENSVATWVDASPTTTNPRTRKEIAVVIDGDTLRLVFGDSQMKSTFYRLVNSCKSVICCRATPIQKAEVVQLMRKSAPTVTLAIGDGANDVSMIQAAHVGVGISGMEGQQASNSSDYAIGQFRFLYRLMLVHGRWNYRRLAKLICYSFYKNIVLYLTQFCFLLWNGWSGQSLYDQWVLALYNVAWTSIPVLVVGIMDRDVHDQAKLYEYPQLYSVGLHNRDFTGWVFVQWLINSVFHAIICFGIPTAAVQGGVFSDGLGFGTVANGTIIYTAAVLVVNLKLALEIESWTVVHHVTVWGSIAVWFIFLLIYGEIFSTALPAVEMYHVFKELAPHMNFWFVSLVTVCIALMRDLLWKYHSYNLRSPDKVELYKRIRVHEQTNPTKPRNEIPDNHPPSTTHSVTRGGDVSHALHPIASSDITASGTSTHGKEAWSEDSKESATKV
eukprot:TRINITY_DN54101_c0_g1_i1.p1 TRINITY_DN54101_c0_g1~~TRINITY_DN54101_c0_g1_i1.p1  ORF type:complete len:1157 (+),score=117.86 TRINITY_DN54101_c0_g1_i1:36-3506(+)